MMDDVLTILNGSPGAVLGMLLLGFLLRNVILTRLTASVALEHQRQLEQTKLELSRQLEGFKQDSVWQQRRREQSAHVAELLSLWCAPNYGIGEFGNRHRHELQRRWWALAGWLDTEVFHAVQVVLMRGNVDPLAAQRAIVAARRVLTGADDSVTPEDLVWFPTMPPPGPPEPKPDDPIMLLADLMTLMEKVATAGVQVLFKNAQKPGGLFDARNGVPVITMHRKDRRCLVDPRFELATLAHEFGHALSWIEGRETDSFAEDLAAHINTEEVGEDRRLEILDEECRAWNRALMVLEDLGRTRAEFMDERDRALEGYRAGLKLDSVNIVDRLAACERGPVREVRPMCSKCCGQRWEQTCSD
jgi:hypothetical protein